MSIKLVAKKFRLFLQAQAYFFLPRSRACSIAIMRAIELLTLVGPLILALLLSDDALPII